MIIDEAHSSQGGETATDLKEVLGGEELREEAKKRAAEEGRDDMEELFRSMAKRGRQANLSFFAFTATPKHKTLAVFGRDGQPAHRYTMRQAIEEEFILDVLKHYTTYATYFKLLKACEDDPNVERKKAAQALARFMRLHPHNIAQKTEVMVEHFQAVTRHKIGGRAKAMVVTGSRLEAVRYKQSFDRYIQEKGYAIKTLVAFSGTVQDDKLADVTYTEERHEPRHPREGAAGEVRHAGVPGAARGGEVPDRVRPAAAAHDVRGQAAGGHPGRADALAPEPHPPAQGRHLRPRLRERPRGDPRGVQDLLRRRGDGRGGRPRPHVPIKGELDASGIYLAEEVERFCAVYFKPKQRQSAMDHQAMNAALDPAVSRFTVRQKENEEEAELWRGKVQAFRNLYGFLSQVIPYQDSDLERLYVFLRHLAAKLPAAQERPGLPVR